MSTLMLIGAGAEQVPAIMAAKRLGHRVLGIDLNTRAPGIGLLDRFFHLSTTDVDAAVALARKIKRTDPIHGVCTVGSDVPYTVARVAQELGLPGIDPESARLATDKLIMKRHFMETGVPIPCFSEADSPAEVMDRVKRFGSVVIKPADSRGSRGVFHVKPGCRIEELFVIAKMNSPSGRVMVEEYLSGPQISTESILLDGIAHTPGFSDRNYEFWDLYAPHVIENGGQMPSVHDPDMRDEAQRLIGHAAASLGIYWGVVKGDLVLTEDGLKIIELAARPSGGFFCTHQIRFATGVDLVEVQIKLALGEKVTAEELQPKIKGGSAIRFVFPKPGEIVSIEGLADARSRPEIGHVQALVEPGDAVDSPTDSNGAAVVVVSRAATRQKSVDAAVEAANSIEVRTR